MTVAQIELPKKMAELFSGEARYRVAKGGRGSGKTRSLAIMSAVYGYKFGMSGRQGQILCAREHLNSLSESSFNEIKSSIKSVPWLDDYYECGDRFIKSKDGRISFVFAGLRRNLDSIKSMSRVLLCWIDEAANVSNDAFVKLIPTIRESESELWISYNPERKDAEVEQRFINIIDSQTKVATINYYDNPFFPKILDDERLRDREHRPELYEHIWEGGFLDYVNGAYFKTQLLESKEGGRMMSIQALQSVPCMTFWDIGASDGTAIWVVQRIGNEYRCVDFYEAWGKPYSHAVQWLQSRGLVWDTHYLPHDASHKRQGQDSNKSPHQMLAELTGINNFEVVTRISDISWGIQQLRDMLGLIWFNMDKCEEGVDHLKSYRRKWSEAERRWLDKPDKAEGHSEAADALRMMAQAYASGQLNVNKGAALAKRASKTRRDYSPF